MRGRAVLMRVVRWQLGWRSHLHHDCCQLHEMQASGCGSEPRWMLLMMLWSASWAFLRLAMWEKAVKVDAEGWCCRLILWAEMACSELIVFDCAEIFDDCVPSKAAISGDERVG